MNLKPKCKPSWHSFFSKNFIAIYIALALILIINQIVFSVLLKDREAAKASLVNLFKDRVIYSVGSGPRGVATADFNNDGKLDLVVANNSSTNVSIVFGVGDGTFTLPATNYAAGGNCQSVTTGDFDHNGLPDLAVGSSGINVLLNTGGGVFGAAVNYGGGTNSVTSVDLNGDGWLDLVGANGAGNTISVLLNNGAGAFPAVVNYTVGSRPYGITVADFNGDGFIDIATGNWNSGNPTNNLSVLFNIPATPGTFNAAVNYAVGILTQPLTSGDFNEDGYIDIAVGDGGDAVIFLNSGTGTFGSPVRFTAGGSSLQDIKAADLDGDGHLDLAEANFANAGYFLPGNGDGTFQTAQYLSTGSRSWSIAIGDYNGDAQLDLAFANNGSNTVTININAICTAFHSGNWNTAGTWSCGHVPTATDSAKIASGATVLMDLDGASCDNLDIYGTLDFGSNAYTLNVGEGLNSYYYQVGLWIENGGDVTGTAAGVLSVAGSAQVDSNISSTTVSLTMIGLNKGLSTATSGVIIPFLTINNYIGKAGNITVSTKFEGTGTLENTLDNLYIGAPTVGPTLLPTPFPIVYPNETIVYNGGDQDIKPVNYHNLTISGTGTKTLVSAGVSGIGVSRNFNIDAGTALNVSGSNSFEPSGNTTISGTLNYSSNMTFNNLTINPSGSLVVSYPVVGILGNYANNGSASFGTATVYIVGGTQQTFSGSMTGSSAFYDLTIVNNYAGSYTGSCGVFTPDVIFANDVQVNNNFTINTPGVRVQFQSLDTNTFNNINWVGAAGNPIVLRNSEEANKWNLAVSGTQVVQYVDVSRSDASGGNRIIADITNKNCRNNTNWTFSASSGSSGSSSYISPIKFTINNDAPATNSLSVNLTIDTQASTMRISNNPEFTDAEWEYYTPTKLWTLTAGAGEKTVYAQFRNASGINSAIVSDSILYQLEPLPSPEQPSSSLILHGSAPAAPLPPGVQIGELVKSATSNSVYFIDEDNRRHSFPNEATYFSWFIDFSGVVTIPANTLSAIPLGSNVTIRPGTYLVKVQTDPRVYAVEPYGVIRWVSSEEIASKLYGTNWSTRIIDIPDSFFVDYQVGSIINLPVHPTGSVIQYSGSSSRYYIENGLMKLISNSVFANNRFQVRFINTNISSAISYDSGADMAAMPIQDLMALR